MASVAIALFFVRFWQRTRDALFIYFAAAFALMAAESLAVSFYKADQPAPPYVYGLRLVAFGLIIVGIWNKNRRAR